LDLRGRKWWEAGEDFIMRRLLGRRMHGREDNIRMDLMEIGWEVVDRIHLAQDRDQWPGLVNMAIDLRVV
jgi:hypothetical protein